MNENIFERLAECSLFDDRATNLENRDSQKISFFSSRKRCSTMHDWGGKQKSRPQNLWVYTFDIAPRQHVEFFASLKNQADIQERSQGLPKQPLDCFLTPVVPELVPTSALYSTEAT